MCSEVLTRVGPLCLYHEGLRGGSVGADIAGEGKPFQGQHGNITFRLHMTAMSCVEAVQEPKMG